MRDLGPLTGAFFVKFRRAPFLGKSKKSTKIKFPIFPGYQEIGKIQFPIFPGYEKLEKTRFPVFPGYEKIIKIEFPSISRIGLN